MAAPGGRSLGDGKEFGAQAGWGAVGFGEVADPQEAKLEPGRGLGFTPCFLAVWSRVSPLMSLSLSLPLCHGAVVVSASGCRGAGSGGRCLGLAGAVVSPGQRRPLGHPWCRSL